MKKLNKKQRKKIYLKAANKFNDPFYIFGICNAINKVSGITIYSIDDYVFGQEIVLLPELNLFNSNIKKDKDVNDYLKCDQNNRQFILLMCAEMCN